MLSRPAVLTFRWLVVRSVPTVELATLGGCQFGTLHLMPCTATGTACWAGTATATLPLPMAYGTSI